MEAVIDGNRESKSTVVRPFLWRRLHSLSGLFLILFLIFHLVTNSQAALWLGEDGAGFIREVNGIHNLPYLLVIEFVLLFIPFALHIGWGVRYLFTASFNDCGGGEKSPYLPYGRNSSYTWQRITAWLLLFGVVAHVVQMRFLHQSVPLQLGSQRYYAQWLVEDPGLVEVAERLGVELLGRSELSNLALSGPFALAVGAGISEQRMRQWNEVREALMQRSLGEGERIAIAPDFGTAMLLLVRDTFKNLWMAFAYTLFVAFASFHAFNGLWTACITWGVTLNSAVQLKSLRICQLLMVLLMFLGWVAIWGTYWINLKT